MTDTQGTPSELTIRTRLTVLFASAAPRAVILRRGPKTHWRLVHWDLATDTFTHGQWMKGLVRLCDLSPTGDKLIYWAAQHHRAAIWDRGMGRAAAARYDPMRTHPLPRPRGRRKLPRYLSAPDGLRLSPHAVTGTWTAISTPPYFTALAIWPSHGHWTGGGIFHTARDIWIHEPESRMVPIENVAIPSTLRLHSLHSAGPTRLAALTRCAQVPTHGEELRSGEVWEGLRAGGATWVDWVHARSEDELLFACDGRVLRLLGWRDIPPDRYLAEARLLIDLTGHAFTPVEAPREAMRW